MPPQCLQSVHAQLCPGHLDHDVVSAQSHPTFEVGLWMPTSCLFPWKEILAQGVPCDLLCPSTSFKPCQTKTVLISHGFIFIAPFLFCHHTRECSGHIAVMVEVPVGSYGIKTRLSASKESHLLTVLSFCSSFHRSFNRKGCQWLEMFR